MRALSIASLFVSVSAFAAEPPGLMKIVKGADKALVDANATEKCKAALHKSDLAGLHCRLIVTHAVAAKAPLVKDVDVDARAALVNDVVAAAEHIANYAPTAPEPGLRRTRFDAHRRACEIAFTSITDLEAMPSEFPGHARAKVVVAGVSTTKALPAVGMRDMACGCAQRSVDLAVGADASPAEQADVQGILTRHRCLLSADDLKIADRKDPSRALANPNDALKSVADASSPAGRLVELAKGRLVEMSRCTDKHLDNKKIKDKPKLATCACGVVKRWHLPFKKDDPKVEAKVPLLDGDQLFLPVVVEGNAITACGDVEGPLLAP